MQIDPALHPEQSTSAPISDRPAGHLADLTAQLRLLDPPAGYDPHLFSREMDELAAEIEQLGRGEIS